MASLTSSRWSLLFPSYLTGFLLGLWCVPPFILAVFITLPSLEPRDQDTCLLCPGIFVSLQPGTQWFLTSLFIHSLTWIESNEHVLCSKGWGSSDEQSRPILPAWGMQPNGGGKHWSDSPASTYSCTVRLSTPEKFSEHDGN